MTRSQRSYGRPGTAVIPPDWSASHRPVAAGTRTGTCEIRHPGGTEGDFEMRDFRFTDGSTLPVLRIHYTTLGRPRKDASGVVRNAVLILHGTTGNGRGFLSRNFGGELFQAGQPLDREYRGRGLR